MNPILVPAHYPNIQKGILHANEGDTVLVAPGLYQGIGNRSIGIHGYDFCLRSESGPQSTTIDCENITSGILSNSNNGPGTVIEGFKIINAFPVGIEVGSSPTIRDCIFGPSDGVGIQVFGTDSNPLIEDCSFVDNTIVFGPGGAGILLERSQSAIIRRCDFEGNTVTGMSSSILRGGGILCVNASPLIWECTFRDNVAKEGGAIAYYENGVWASTKGPRIDGCLIAGNLATNQGGGVWFHKANTWIDGTTISGNRAQSRGGGVYFGIEDTVSVRRTILWDNCADVQGDEMMLASFIVQPTDIQVNFECSDVDSLGFSGLGTIQYVADNIFVNPEFENPESCNSAPTSLGDYGLECFSPCLPTNSPCGQLIGAPQDFCPIVAVEEPAPAPKQFQLQPAYPNPFSGQSVIQYEIPQAAKVELSVFDLRGRRVRVLESSTKAPGRYTSRWDGRDEEGSRVASGMYFYRLRMGEIAETQSVLFLPSAQE